MSLELLLKPFVKIKDCFNYLEKETEYAKLYSEFYEKIEQMSKQDIEQRLKIINTVTEKLKGASYLGTVLLGAYSSYKGFNKGLKLEDYILGVSFAVALGGMYIHFSKARILNDAIYRKKSGKIITEKEINKLKTTKKIGRAAHITAGLGITGVLTSIMIQDSFLLILAPIMVPIVAASGRYVFWKTYGPLYDADLDYILGERKKLEDKNDH